MRARAHPGEWLRPLAGGAYIRARGAPMPATTDRAEIMHFAGRHRLSPALRGGAPALVEGPDPDASRCGWAPFFDAMMRARLALAAGAAGDGAPARFVPRAEARARRDLRGAFATALDRSRRLVRALRAPPRAG